VCAGRTGEGEEKHGWAKFGLTQNSNLSAANLLAVNKTDFFSAFCLSTDNYTHKNVSLNKEIQYLISYNFIFSPYIGEREFAAISM
jgi:hypothetical protein